MGDFGRRWSAHQSGPGFKTLLFLRYLAPKARALDNTKLESFAGDKRSSLLGPFVRQK